jgi:hypothetical protein
VWTRAWRSVPANVWFLGATSLLTDLSSEMVVSILPLYLVVQLGFSPLAFGALDGLYNAIGALTRLLSGVAVDRWIAGAGPKRWRWPATACRPCAGWACWQPAGGGQGWPRRLPSTGWAKASGPCLGMP